MARFESSTFGKISGKHGTAVAAVRKDGTCILKVYQAASNPNTAGQKNQRGKFGFVMKELNCMRSLYGLTFGGQYGINKAVSLAMKTAVIGDFPDFRIDYNKLPISTGSLNNTAEVELEYRSDNTVKISWNIAHFMDGSPADNVHLVFLNPKLKFAITKHECATRNDGNVEVELPASWVEKEIHSWIFFSSPDNRRFSTSLYNGLLNFSESFNTSAESSGNPHTK